MAEQKATNVHWHEHSVSKAERRQLSGHKGAVLWFTGLSASGKSTVANTVDHKLHSLGKRSFVLDGDNIRMGLNKNLAFSAEDRAENIRRIGEVAKLFFHRNGQHPIHRGTACRRGAPAIPRQPARSAR